MNYQHMLVSNVDVFTFYCIRALVAQKARHWSAELVV